MGTKAWRRQSPNASKAHLLSVQSLQLAFSVLWVTSFLLFSVPIHPWDTPRSPTPALSPHHPPPSLKTTWLLCPGGRGCWNAGLPLASAWGKGARGWIFGCLWKALSLQGPRMVSQAFHSRSERWVLQQNCDWGNKWWVSFFITFLHSSLSFK